MFTKIYLDYENNLFDELHATIEFEDITKGRKGAVLIDKVNDIVPIVRTTTKYSKPAQQFKKIHHDIIDKIKQNYNGANFNNALAEIYDSEYTNMGFHSDQALDLAPNSHIAIYSCYSNDKVTNPRKLIIKDKTTNNITEITMEGNSVILFDLDTNGKHLHKIILEANNKTNDEWLGITSRMSKTFIDQTNGNINGTDDKLTLADNVECKHFYKLRGEENKSVNFTYDKIAYTISPSDLMYVK